MNAVPPIPTEVPLPPQAETSRQPISPQRFYTPPGVVGDGNDDTVPPPWSEADSSPPMSVHGTVARLHAAHPVAEHADMDGVVVLSSAVAGV